MPIIGTDNVIDISSFQGNPDFVKLKGAGIVGVIHKATEGLGFHDTAYAANKIAAKAAGLLWGAYHFGTGSDATKQADEFMRVAAVGPNDLIALDYEDNNPPGTQMSLAQARTFVQRVHAISGRWPGLYSGNTVKTALGATVDPLLANCWLWLAQYAPPPTTQASWPKWTLWQYTDGKNGQTPVAGLNCDRNTFAGSTADLTAFWRSGGTVLPAI